MKPERRVSDTPDRRQRRGTHPPAAHTETASAALDDAALLREQTTGLREKDLLLREAAIEERESDFLRREEKLAAQQGKLSARRIQEISDAQIVKATQKFLNDNLRQANQNLVIATLQSQTATEEIEKSKEAISHLANHDFLTNLPNRMQLHDRITQAIAHAKRHDEKLAVLFLDLDRFKLVNDTLGHAIGDQLLQAVAQRLKGAIRSSDTVSRQGGDEFILVLSEVSHERTLAQNVEKIHEIVTAPYSVEGNDLFVGATIGISIYPEDGDDTETLIRNADAAMYYAKESGRNRYQFFRQEIRTSNAERQRVEASLFEAIDQQQFALFYQAQINLASGAITGAEALLRWNHPTQGVMLPAWFVPIAEECGAMVPIGHWVLREACRQAQEWLQAGLAINVITVNISACEFEHEDFIENVRTILQETGLAPEHLELELTESVLMKSLECTALTIDVLRSMGVRISIDDFGTGHSSLRNLKRLPADTMKIDQSFVRDISSGDDDILINAVIGIGKSLRHHVIAEGVETEQQFAYLRENHCPTAQGFYFNVPMVAGEFATLLKTGVAEKILSLGLTH